MFKGKRFAERVPSQGKKTLGEDYSSSVRSVRLMFPSMRVLITMEACAASGRWILSCTFECQIFSILAQRRSYCKRLVEIRFRKLRRYYAKSEIVLICQFNIRVCVESSYDCVSYFEYAIATPACRGCERGSERRKVKQQRVRATHVSLRIFNYDIIKVA